MSTKKQKWPKIEFGVSCGNTLSFMFKKEGDTCWQTINVTRPTARLLAKKINEALKADR